MTTVPKLHWKAEVVSRGILWSGIVHLLSALPERDSLTILNYHRIGDAGADLFDPGVFSVTADEFADHIAYLKQHVSLIGLDEALRFVDGSVKEKRRARVLITLDDGYLDNFEIAFPILRSYGVQGVFFLVTGLIGSSAVPWWDHIAYLLKTARRRRFVLRYPVQYAVNIDRDGLDGALQAALRLYKRPDNGDPDRFIAELGEAAHADAVPTTIRRFLSWEEAQKMIAGGMAIGSHTHSHHVLSQLQPDQQFVELSQSLKILRDHLGGDVNVLAYPVGAKTSFTKATEEAAKRAGYRAAFSFYGGTNLPGEASPYDLKRITVTHQSLIRTRVQCAFGNATGRFWP